MQHMLGKAAHQVCGISVWVNMLLFWHLALHCRMLSADVPYELTPEFLEDLFTKHRIDYIVHGDDPCLLPDGTDAYAHAKQMGRFKMVSTALACTPARLCILCKPCVCHSQLESRQNSVPQFVVSLTCLVSVVAIVFGQSITSPAMYLVLLCLLNAVLMLQSPVSCAYA